MRGKLFCSLGLWMLAATLVVGLTSCSKDEAPKPEAAEKVADWAERTAEIGAIDPFPLRIVHQRPVAPVTAGAGLPVVSRSDRGGCRVPPGRAGSPRGG